MEVYFLKKQVITVCFQGASLPFASRSHQLLTSSMSAVVTTLCCSQRAFTARYSSVPHYNSFYQLFPLLHYFLNGCCSMTHKIYCTVVSQLQLFWFIFSCILLLFTLSQPSTILIKEEDLHTLLLLFPQQFTAN